LPAHFDIILNPTAGQGTAAGRIHAIRQAFDSDGRPFRIHCTDEPGHAVRLAEDLAANSESVVIAAGGDGTCNEVINGLMSMVSRDGNHHHRPLFGVLPIGRGNDFAFGAGVPDDMESAIAGILEGKLRSLDIGRVSGGDFPDGRWFGNGIGIGFDAIVGFEANRMKRLHGSAAYTIGALKTLAKYPAAPEIEFRTDEATVRIRPALVSIMNGRRMGGSFFMAPDAESDDGLLNWCRTDQGSRMKLLSAMMSYTKGSQSSRSDTETGSASSFSVEAISGTLAVHADGETICERGRYLSVSVSPAALRIVGSLQA